jgi:hypothetical protein
MSTALKGMDIAFQEGVATLGSDNLYIDTGKTSISKSSNNTKSLQNFPKQLHLRYGQIKQLSMKTMCLISI